MVVNSQTPVLLIYKGGLNDKIQPVVKTARVKNNNNNKRSFNEQKKRNVQTTAAILRISEQGKSQTRTD
jgi:ketol-acid reductoisomerase